MYVPGSSVIEEIDEKHANRAYVATSNANLPHTTGEKSNTTRKKNAEE